MSAPDEFPDAAANYILQQAAALPWDNVGHKVVDDLQKELAEKADPSPVYYHNANFDYAAVEAAYAKHSDHNPPPQKDEPIHGTGQFRIVPLAEMNAFRVEWIPPTVNWVISAESLEHHMQGEWMIQGVLGQMTKYLRDRLHGAWGKYSKEMEKTPEYQKGGLVAGMTAIYHTPTSVYDSVKSAYDSLKHIYAPVIESQLSQLPSAQGQEFVLKGMVTGHYSTGPKKQQNNIVATLAALIPGFQNMRQPCPVPYTDGFQAEDESECDQEHCGMWGYKKPSIRLATTIQHLNDLHRWPRERIADWLETLDHDLDIQTPEEVKADDEDSH